MRKISLMMMVFLVAACMTEIKPVLKPAVIDIPDRIADQQRWLDQYITLKTIERKDAKPIQEKLVEIKGKYDRLQSAEALTAKDSEAINKMLDQTSEEIFRLSQKKQRSILTH